MKITRKTSSTLCVDIHGMREREAKFRLESLIENGSADITRLEIIHGFNGGDMAWLNAVAASIPPFASTAAAISRCWLANCWARCSSGGSRSARKPSQSSWLTSTMASQNPSRIFQNKRPLRITVSCTLCCAPSLW